MVYNICGFVKFARDIKKQESWEHGNGILYVPIILLCMFLAGYLIVGIFGKPDLIMAGILFFGSVFVFIIYRLLSRITRKIRENQKIKAELMAAEESSQAKSEFLANISHEMRTPLNVIIGLDNMVLKQQGLNPETRDYLKRIDLSATHLMGLIDNILDLNRIERGAMDFNEEPFSMEFMLDQVNALMETVCENKGLSYEYEADASNPEVWYLGDETRIKQILLSLLDNAVKYTDAPGNVKLTMKQSSAGTGADMLRFTVEDTGVGIEEEFIPKVFDLFSKEDASSTGRFGGSGLGLSVVKQIVGMMDGTISLESEKDVGTKVTVNLPLRHAKEDKQDLHREMEKVSLAGKRVLIVEDIPDNAEIVQDLLELEDVETELAENGQIALDMFGSSEPGYYDAILMDLRMPVMDGIEATRRIRDLKKDDAKSVPIIALTANALESDVQDTINAGMNAHLAKPTETECLYDTLKKYITERERRQAAAREAEQY